MLKRVKEQAAASAGNFMNEFHDIHLNIQSLLLAAFELWPGFVMRGPELVTLEVSDSPERGNLFYSVTHGGTASLAFVGTVGKTKRPSFGIIPFPLARLLLVFLQACAVQFTPVLVSEASALYDKGQESGLAPDEEAEAFDKPAFERLCMRLLSTSMACTGHLNRDFVVELKRGDCERLLRGGTRSIECLRFLTAEKGRDLVTTRLCAECMDAPDLTFAKLRHVLIVYKVLVDQFAENLLECGGAEPGTQEKLMNFRKEMQRIKASLEAISAFGSTGMHTSQTNLQNYQPSVGVGGNLRTPQLQFWASQLVEAYLGLLNGFRERDSSLGKPGRPTRDMTIYERLVAEEAFGEMTLEEFVEQQAKEMFGVRGFLNHAQEQGAMEILKSKKTKCLLPMRRGENIGLSLALCLVFERLYGGGVSHEGAHEGCVLIRRVQTRGAVRDVCERRRELHEQRV